MRILEFRQSNTSPLKYHIELTPEEMKALQSIVKVLVETEEQVPEDKE